MRIWNRDLLWGAEQECGLGHLGLKTPIRDDVERQVHLRVWNLGEDLGWREHVRVIAIV